MSRFDCPGCGGGAPRLAETETGPACPWCGFEAEHELPEPEELPIREWPDDDVPNTTLRDRLFGGGSA